MIHTNSTTPRFQVISESQFQELYQAALQCLHQIGVQVGNAEARELLATAGAQVENDIVRIAPGIIERALATTPPSFRIWGREQEECMTVAIDYVNYGPGLTNTDFLDPATGSRRRTRSGDPAMTAHVCDALENIDYVMGLGLIDDVTPELADVYEFAELIEHTTKPILAWAYNTDNLDAIYDMAAMIVGGPEKLRERPTFGVFTTYQSPLVNTDEDLAKVLWAAEHGVPSIYMGGAIVGLSSPMTGASALTISLATALSGLTVAQLKRPHAAIALGGVSCPADLRTSRIAYGAPESSLYAAAFADLCRYLNVPFMGTGGVSESKLNDAQATLESTLQLVFSTLSGTPLIHDLGFLDSAELGSLTMLVILDELVSILKRVMRGVEVNADTIMLDLIEQVGPGGHFMAEPRSAWLCRQEVWVPTLMDRDHHTVWEQKGGLSLEQRAWQKLHHILNTHQVKPLGIEAQRSIGAMLDKVEAETTLRKRRRMDATQC